jgi:GT2 family glycosyltransferase
MDAVTVTYNNSAPLRRLLECQPLRAAFDRIFVVDAGSTDESTEIAAGLGAIVVARDARGGYGTCVNQGVQLTSGSVLAVLNPDITFEDESTPDRLAEHFQDPQVAIVAPALVLPDGTLQDSARLFPTPFDLLARRRFTPKLGAIRSSGVVPWVVGACFVVRRQAWDEICGFDEGYFMYFDDVDLCWRMRRAGWMTIFDATIRVNHEHAAASRSPVWNRRTRMHIVSAMRFYRRHPEFILSRDGRAVLGRRHQGVRAPDTKSDPGETPS